MSPLTLPHLNQSLSLDIHPTDDAQPLAVDGMNAGAPIRQLRAITSMSAPSAQTVATLPQIVQIHHPKNKSSPLSSRWDKRAKYAREYVWALDEPPYVSTALFSESTPPVPSPPHN